RPPALPLPGVPPQLHGDADRILPIQVTGIPLARSLHASRFAIIEGGPHGLLWTHGERINRELLEFLARRPEAMRHGAAAWP
ncbi:MAG: alpha/beta fold hydrolase, partial [Kofleriaceae bacterium]